MISMALTPTLSSIGDKIAGYIDQQERKNSLDLALLSGENVTVKKNQCALTP